MRRDVFQAIADPTRRAIIDLLAKQTMTPNTVAEHFNTSRQSVSKHIKFLVECDLVSSAHRGREIHYRLEMRKMKEIDKWLGQYRQIWDKKFNQLDVVLNKIKKTKHGK